MTKLTRYRTERVRILMIEYRASTDPYDRVRIRMTADLIYGTHTAEIVFLASQTRQRRWQQREGGQALA